MIKTSSYELIVINILKGNSIKFEREKQFRDLDNGRYRYDFFVPSKNILIEADGLQHFKYIRHFHKKESSYTKAKERDRRKNSYALAHGITLYRIPCWEFANVKTLDNLLQEKFIVRDKYHNDVVWNKHKS